MRNIILILLLIYGLLSCINNVPENSNKIGNQSMNRRLEVIRKNWPLNLDSLNPLQFLESIKIVHGTNRPIILEPFELKNNKSTEKSIMTSKVPKNWIKIQYIDSLIKLMDDHSLTMPVFSAYANESPDNKPYTTVGIEAMRLIQGYKNKWYPSLWPEYYVNDTFSSQYKDSKRGLTTWWKNRK